jgi:hypothetical protein
MAGGHRRVGVVLDDRHDHHVHGEQAEQDAAADEQAAALPQRHPG